MKKSACKISSVLTAVLIVNTTVFSWFSWGKKDENTEKSKTPKRSVKVQYTYLDTLNRGNEIQLTDNDFKDMMSTESNTETVPEGKKEIPNGYRVQCFASSQIDRARAEKKNIEAKIKKNVYISFKDPYYKLLVGDFTKRSSAEITQADLKNLGYTDAWIVRSKIFVKQ